MKLLLLLFSKEWLTRFIFIVTPCYFLGNFLTKNQESPISVKSEECSPKRSLRKQRRTEEEIEILSSDSDTEVVSALIVFTVLILLKKEITTKFDCPNHTKSVSLGKGNCRKEYI
jgi:hypothetical protein